MPKEIEEIKETEKISRGTLKLGEPHPAAYIARNWIATIPFEKLWEYQGSFASVALSGNRMAEICFETLDRLLTSTPVSDRYVMGLAWALKTLEENKSSKS